MTTGDFATGDRRLASGGAAGRVRDPDAEATPDAAPNDAPPASDAAERALERQRAKHEPPDCDVDDTGVGALVNNTGLDGDAATG